MEQGLTVFEFWEGTTERSKLSSCHDSEVSNCLMADRTERLTSELCDNVQGPDVERLAESGGDKPPILPEEI